MSCGLTGSTSVLADSSTTPSELSTWMPMSPDWIRLSRRSLELPLDGRKVCGVSEAPCTEDFRLFSESTKSLVRSRLIMLAAES